MGDKKQRQFVTRIIIIQRETILYTYIQNIVQLYEVYYGT
jgi:hypothetical protein